MRLNVLWYKILSVSERVHQEEKKCYEIFNIFKVYLWLLTNNWPVSLY